MPLDQHFPNNKNKWNINHLLKTSNKCNEEADNKINKAEKGK